MRTFVRWRWFWPTFPSTSDPAVRCQTAPSREHVPTQYATEKTKLKISFRQNGLAVQFLALLIVVFDFFCRHSLFVCTWCRGLGFMFARVLARVFIDGQASPPTHKSTLSAKSVLSCSFWPLRHRMCVIAKRLGSLPLCWATSGTSRTVCLVCN